MRHGAVPCAEGGNPAAGAKQMRNMSLRGKPVGEFLEFFSGLLSCSLSTIKSRLAYRPQPGQGSTYLQVPKAGGRTSRRRFDKLSYAGWLPHYRGFVSGLPRSRRERRSMVIGS